jgi:hypothetical protein
VGGPTAGGAEPAGPTRLFSMRVESELSKLGRLTPARRINLKVPAPLAAYPAVTLLNERRTAGVFECDGGSKAADQVSVEETDDRLVLTFQCRAPRVPGGQPGQGTNRFSIAFLKSSSGKLFGPAPAGLLHRPRLPLRGARIQDDGGTARPVGADRAGREVTAEAERGGRALGPRA